MDVDSLTGDSERPNQNQESKGYIGVACASWPGHYFNFLLHA
jgi:hypothetical protein